MILRILPVLTIISACLPLQAQPKKDSFYKGPGLFSTRPSDTETIQNIKRLGPVGLSIDLCQPAFVMKVAALEEGSPAARTGKFEKGQIIESVYGEALKDIDPRMQMAKWVEKAESTDGRMPFKIKGVDEVVVVQLEVLGAYADSWPLNCPKSEKIVRGLADYIASDSKNYGLGDLGMFFLISTGEEKDTKVVGEWARKANNPSKYAWFLGFGGIPLCEYYLRTGDREVLANIQKWVDSAVSGQYNDAWAGRGGVPGLRYGNGHLNAAGTAVVTFLLLAKECGANVPDHALHGALRHFYRYAGRGGNPYGDDRPECGFVDNGKNGNLAFAMAAAAALTPDGENSVYAGARDITAMSSFYTTSFMLHGHTGGGIGEIWRSSSMGLMKDKKPTQYRDFMDNRRWHYELSRRYDGSFGILGGGGYDVEKWGVAYGLCYTVPRKTMRITGAAPTKWSKPFQLPKQPWGVEADNEFLSLEPVPFADGTKMDLSKETLAEDASIPFLRKFHGPKDIPDDLIRHYIHHPEPVIRRIAAAKALGVNRGYIGWLAEGGELRPQLVLEFLKSDSARIRRAMYAALDNVIRREKRPELLTQEIFDLAAKAVNDPKESWWVKDAAMHVMSHGGADQVVPHVDVLLGYLDMEGWWLRNAAMKALTPAVGDARCYRKILEPIGSILRKNQRVALTTGLLPEMRARIRESIPEVQKFAVETLKETYTGFAGVNTAPGGQDISSTAEGHLAYIAQSLAEMPGGLDVLYTISRERKPDAILPYKELFLNADPSGFGPELKKAIKPIIMDELVPEYVGRNRKKLRDLASLEKQDDTPGGKGDNIDELVALYDRAGFDEYNWHEFLNLREADWQYDSFDPTEKMPWDFAAKRFREVTLPSGMEQWHDPSFDPLKAGWKTGKSPFGHWDGKIPKGLLSKCSEKCVGPVCYGSKGANTLWEKEVLLMRGTFKVPALKEGHRYRVVVNSRVHVGNGPGFAIYVNGKQLVEDPMTIGRGQGELANGGFITKEFLDDFSGGEVTFAVKSFLRYNDKRDAKPTQKLQRGLISIHLDEQKLPPMGDEFVIRSASVVQMRTSAWDQAKQQEEQSNEVDADSLLYRWDGKWVANPAVMGDWKLHAVIADPAAFDPETDKAGKSNLPNTMKIKEEGETSDSLMLWSGNKLFDLNNYHALEMVQREVGAKRYLFVESGNFNGRKKPHWEKDWVVYARP